MKLCRVLYKYRITPQSTTQETPAKLLMGRHLKTPLDFLRPDLSLRVEERQRQQKVWHDSKATHRTLEIGDAVFARNYGKGEEWIPAEIVSKSGPLSYVITWGSNGFARRHIDQLRKRFFAATQESPPFHPISPTTGIVDTNAADSYVVTESQDTTPVEVKEECPPLVEPVIAAPETLADSADLRGDGLRRSMRARRPPDRLVSSSVS